MAQNPAALPCQSAPDEPTRARRARQSWRCRRMRSMMAVRINALSSDGRPEIPGDQHFRNCT
eukprot:4911995-Lingulodinium_polyedra.AAC.1